MKYSDKLDEADKANHLAPCCAYLMSATNGIVHNNYSLPDYVEDNSDDYEDDDERSEMIAYLRQEFVRRRRDGDFTTDILVVDPFTLGTDRECDSYMIHAWIEDGKIKYERDCYTPRDVWGDEYEDDYRCN